MSLQGPRQDAGLVSDVDPGVVLMKKIYMYLKKYHPGSQLMASGLRSKAQALNLAGLEYMVVSPPVGLRIVNRSLISVCILCFVCSLIPTVHARFSRASKIPAHYQASMMALGPMCPAMTS